VVEVGTPGAFARADEVTTVVVAVSGVAFDVDEPEPGAAASVD
jgi:hypothetical protein